MRHREAMGYLPEFGSESLDPVAALALTHHAEQCSACRDWLETRALLASALGGGQEVHLAEHPRSDLLALCAVRPEEIHEPDREEIRIHLQDCAACRGDLELARRAVQHARPSAELAERPEARAVHRPFLPPTARAIAAALAVVLLGAGVFTGGVLFGRIGSTEEPLADDPSAMLRSRAQSRASEQLSGRELDGIHVLGAEGRLVVSELTVRSGADVTFRAGDSIAFGDGFRVLAGARVQAGSGPPAVREPPTSADDDPARARHSKVQAEEPLDPRSAKQ